jgi:hypothetical protein
MGTRRILVLHDMPMPSREDVVHTQNQPLGKIKWPMRRLPSRLLLSCTGNHHFSFWTGCVRN